MNTEKSRLTLFTHAFNLNMKIVLGLDLSFGQNKIIDKTNS